jgi:hypothetical protein
VAGGGCLTMLVAALQEPEPALKRAAACALGEIANPAPALAAAVAEAGALPILIQVRLVSCGWLHRGSVAPAPS